MLSLALAFTLALAPSDSVIKRGEPLPDRPALSLAEVLQSPDRFAKEGPILIAGVVERNCTTKGCWMQVAPAAGQPGVRVTFKDYAFFIPLESKGKKVKAIGTLVTKEHPKDHADHLEAEGASLRRNADGSATEITFVASGVELSS